MSIRDRESKVYKLLARKKTTNIPNTTQKHSQWCSDMNLISELREVKNIQECQYLKHVSQQPFCRNNVLGGFWIKGYIIEITPIRGKEKFQLIEFSLENGYFVSHPFALAPGKDGNYLSLLSVLGVEPLTDGIPPETFFREFWLFVSSKLEGGMPSFYLHDIASL